MSAPPRPAWNEFDPVTDLVLKHPREAFDGDERIERQWRDLRFSGPPSYLQALDEYAAFHGILESTGATLRWLPGQRGDTLDSIYVRDASVVCPKGVILCGMGKPQRAWEPAAQGEAFRAWGLPVAGEIRSPGRLEGGDVVWLDDRTVVVGRGYRTNDEGIRQFGRLLDDDVEVVVVPLPHWRGPGDVFHLMSILSPVDRDLAVVYSPLLPVPFRERLLERGMQLVEVPDGEFESMGANVLAVAPRRCVALAGNPRTRSLLEAAGAEVRVYVGEQISMKGGGGPTCLTRPIARRAALTSG